MHDIILYFTALVIASWRSGKAQDGFLIWSAKDVGQWLGIKLRLPGSTHSVLTTVPPLHPLPNGDAYTVNMHANIGHFYSQCNQLDSKHSSLCKTTSAPLLVEYPSNPAIFNQESLGHLWSERHLVLNFAFAGSKANCSPFARWQVQHPAGIQTTPMLSTNTTKRIQCTSCTYLSLYIYNKSTFCTFHKPAFWEYIILAAFGNTRKLDLSAPWHGS